ETLTVSELRNPQVFAQAAARIPGYPTAYNYDQFAHVRVAKLPLKGLRLRPLLDFVFPGWDEKLEWSLLLEREWFSALTVAFCLTAFFLVFRLLLGRYADRRLKIPRFRLRSHLLRAGEAFFTTPEIK